MSTPSRAARLALSLLLAALAALSIAACGSSSKGSSSSSSADPGADRAKFASCMRKQGVDLPQGGPGQAGGPPRNIDTGKLRTAIQACRKYAPNGGNISTAQRQEFRDAFVKFSACMRKQGVDIPDVGNGNGPPAGGPRRFNLSDPKIQAAAKSCQKLLPRGGRGGGFGGPPGGGPAQ